MENQQELMHTLQKQQEEIQTISGMEVKIIDPMKQLTIFKMVNDTCL